jgi:hypothetical protein
MRLAIITYSRSNEYQYLRQTLADMERQDPSVKKHEVSVFVDALTAPRLPAWVRVEVGTKEYLDRRANMLLLNSSNMQRALRWLAASSPYCCLLEDDLVFARNWWRRAISLALRVEEQAGPMPWGLKTEHWEPMAGPVDPVLDAQGFQKWPADQDIWGTQSYIMPGRFANLLSDMIEKGILEHNGDPPNTFGDFLVQKMLRASPPMVNLYVSNQSLTKHVGEISGAYPSRALGKYTAIAFDERDRLPAPAGHCRVSR